jgi:DNA polymerase/3'-5' exonuclease PolX
MDMDLVPASKIADEVMERLAPSCSRKLVVGSIRRQKPRVKDVDIVVIPRNQGQLAVALRDLGQKIRQGPLIYSCTFRGFQVDIYIATPETWVTLVLIRTGSKEHNIKMCSAAKKQGLKLHANGSGITVESTGEFWAGEIKSERDIFAALEVPYLEPRDR